MVEAALVLLLEAALVLVLEGLEATHHPAEYKLRGHLVFCDDE